MAHNTIQWLKCIVHYLDMKIKEKYAEMVELKFVSSLKYDCV